MAVNEMTRLYDTLLIIPGMNDQVKLNLQISRKVVLMLSHQLLEAGMRRAKDNPEGVLAFFPEQTGDERRAIIEELLGKAGLTELSGKLKAFK